MWSLGFIQQPFSCVLGHFRHGDEQTTKQPTGWSLCRPALDHWEGSLLQKVPEYVQPCKCTLSRVMITPSVKLDDFLFINILEHPNYFLIDCLAITKVTNTSISHTVRVLFVLWIAWEISANNGQNLNAGSLEYCLSKFEIALQSLDKIIGDTWIILAQIHLANLMISLTKNLLQHPKCFLIDCLAWQ